MNYIEEIRILDLEHDDYVCPEDRIRRQKVKPDYRPIKLKKDGEPDMRGKFVRSEETKRKQSESIKRYWNSEKAILRKNSDKIDKRFIPRSEEYRKYMSEYMKKYYREHPEMGMYKGKKMNEHPRKYTEEQRRQISERQKGDFWITDGHIEHRVHKGTEVPEGWWRGRLPFKDEHKEKISESERQTRQIMRQGIEEFNSVNTETM